MARAVCKYCRQAHSDADCPLVEELSLGGAPSETAENTLVVRRILNAYLAAVALIPGAEPAFKLREVLRELDVLYVNKKIDLPREVHGMIVNALGTTGSDG